MWIIILVVVLIVAGGAYYFLSQDEGTNTNNTNNANAVVNSVSNANVSSATNENVNAATNGNTNTETNTNEDTNTNTTVDTSDWKTYEDDEFGFTFKYPDGWKLSHFDNGTVSVAPLNFQEPIPLLKALAGNAADMAGWITNNWLDPESAELVRTSSQFTLGNTTGHIYQIDNQDYAVIAELDSYSIAVRMNVLEPTIPFTDYVTQYQAIVQSIQI